FIAKEVVEAHNNHTLSCTSELLYDHNYYGIKSFFDFVDKQKQLDYGLKLYNNLLDEEDKYSKSDYNRNRNQWEDKISPSYQHKSIDFDHISNFINIKFELFSTFERLYFNPEVYETTFTIRFYR
ncbi:MAG: hypothetical protein LBL58_12665, partial [Tannerellaceae bacterium]|nr:hypothetical protein [Tannerellaceae bacterium]